MASPPALPARGARPRIERPLWLAALAGALVGTPLGLAGFYMARIPGRAGAMGTVMFFLVPLAAGLAIALVIPSGRAVAAAALLSLVLSLLILISLKAEGMLCAILAFPIMFVALLVGVCIGWLLRRIFAGAEGKQPIITSCVLVLIPFAIYSGHRVEVKTLVHPRTEAVETTILLPATPGQVWANIQSLPAVEGKKPLLMYFGLPVPQRCVLEATAAGSKRICYFDHGSIEERVLEWDPPRRMLLAIDRTNMPGRHWLEFEGAEYVLTPESGGTRLTRNTTIRSNLYPAWYWRPLEREGVQDEHEYLFSDLARRFPGASAPTHQPEN